VISVSARVQYACLAVLELAKHTDRPRPTRIDEIATEQGIPKQFLVHILLQLKQKGILSSARGVGGGYALAKTPQEITVGDVIRAVESTLTTPETRSGPQTESSGANALFFSLWKRVEQQAVGVLDTVTFDQLLHQLTNTPEYVI
jgi:Rrf2 family protein